MAVLELDFFCEVRTKYRTFPRTTHNTNIHQYPSIDHRNHVRWPPNRRTMATTAIQQHRQRLPSPRLPSKPSILPGSQQNSLGRDTKLGERAAAPAQDVLGRGNPSHFKSIRASMRGVGQSGGHNNQLRGEAGAQQTTKCIFCVQSCCGLGQ